jgi:acylphosphatase
MTEVLRIVVSGDVQGVGFREFTRLTAQRLGVAGWVRNLPSGQVELLARIPAGRKAAFLAQLRQGPRMGKVDGLAVEQAPPETDCPQAGFMVRS